MALHVTYIRDADRTRVIFVLGSNDVGCPEGFRFAGSHEQDAPLVRVPMDGDDYGASGVPIYNGQMIWPS